MQNHKAEFIQFCVAKQVLRFGDFTLKSGRQSPYFFNAGLFNTGAALAALGEFYAQTIASSELNFDMLFGPAYKGIPLVSSIAIALANKHGRDFPFAFNRKEAKDHGEGGLLVGAPLKGRVLIVDDVITAGTAVRETLQLITAAGAEPAGVVVSLDRQERGLGPLSAIQEVEQQFGIPVICLVTLDDVIAFVANEQTLQAYLPRIEQYRKTYAVD